jgi:hypothetical protein
MSHFKPDFAVIDCRLGREASRDIAIHLSEDPRIPHVRVVLAGASTEFPSHCEKDIFARMLRPFGVSDINWLVNHAADELWNLDPGNFQSWEEI